MRIYSWMTTIVILVASGLFMGGATALTVAPSGEMRAAQASADPVHQVRWVCRGGQRCFWVSPRAFLAQSLGDADRQAPRDEKGDRGAGAPVGRDHAPHMG